MGRSNSLISAVSGLYVSVSIWPSAFLFPKNTYIYTHTPTLPSHPPCLYPPSVLEHLHPLLGDYNRFWDSRRFQCILAATTTRTWLLWESLSVGLYQNIYAWEIEINDVCISSCELVRILWIYFKKINLIFIYLFFLFSEKVNTSAFTKRIFISL